MEQIELNPAEKASIECLDKVFKAIDSNKNFRVEAGAGAGKTYTLIKALNYLIGKNSKEYLKQNKKIACLTYTTVARNEIRSRNDNHPILFAETLHAFCWELIKDFQNALRIEVPNLSDNWKQRTEEVGDLGKRTVTYNLGYPKITDNEIFLHHDDVIKLISKLLSEAKFQAILTSRFPIILIDEYQDTRKELADALINNFIVPSKGPLIGFFGDHWQTIYGTKSCGLISAPPDKLEIIGKEANFRSERLIVDSLNRLRPDLPQHISNPQSEGVIKVYHSNLFQGVRRNDSPWKEDLPEEIAHDYLEKTINTLLADNWVFSSDKTKILMLTNNVLANEQGYRALADQFKDPEDYKDKKDDYIAYLSDIVEPGVNAFINGKYGEMFEVFKMKVPSIRCKEDKVLWHDSITQLIEARDQKTIGEVIELLKETKKPRFSRRVEEKENQFSLLSQKLTEELTDAEKILLGKIRGIKAISYNELISMVDFIEDKTLYSTKHGVKGAEFENVIIVFGRGWNNYNWNQMLEWMHDGAPHDKIDSFERNRNLFYVACSRPQKRLALLFTQKLSEKAITQLKFLFGDVVEALQV